MKKQKKSFDSLIEPINNYLESYHSEQRIANTEVHYSKTLDCVNALAQIFEECLSYGNFKDEWDYDKFYEFLYGPELIITSIKTNCGYKLGINDKGLYLSMNLHYSENLRYMDNKYWKLLLALSDFKDFEYEEYEFIRNERRNEFPELFKTNKSMIYRIMRKYIFDFTETHSSYQPGSVGEFKIIAPFNEDFSQSVKKFCETFKIMYKLNYDLWKITDLKNKKTATGDRY
ncbi:hypothetical protein [Chryseobacterium sp. OV279]|uniref:hypothetical protein n=1 Tax=Chryseobacterium sp. OV279 TaxID=1500285 RepID=UPI0009128869|nr:hypothetical protein [Chryseobacterium sp. OV279]SHF39781.1 hypothetical protein SAMN02787100_1879 [Chryseobacterium sp. OV279]